MSKALIVFEILVYLPFESVYVEVEVDGIVGGVVFAVVIVVAEDWEHNLVVRAAWEASENA